MVFNPKFLRERCVANAGHCTWLQAGFYLWNLCRIPLKFMELHTWHWACYLWPRELAVGCSVWLAVVLTNTARSSLWKKIKVSQTVVVVEKDLKRPVKRNPLEEKVNVWEPQSWDLDLWCEAGCIWTGAGSERSLPGETTTVFWMGSIRVLRV